MSLATLEHEKGWQHECFIATGVTAFAIALILGISSLPSVTNVLTWKEFAFVQSKLGWICLCFGIAHDMFFAWQGLLSVRCNFFLHGGMYALWIPCLTLAMKLPLIFSPIDAHLTKIRGGWTRGVQAEKAPNNKIAPI